MIFKKICSYLTFQKQEGTKNLNTQLMHGMNRISILMFVIALGVIIVRFVIKP
ncbi:MAG: DUF6728 family protein [Bacteroidia bacterium]